MGASHSSARDFFSESAKMAKGTQSCLQVHCSSQFVPAPFLGIDPATTSHGPHSLDPYPSTQKFLYQLRFK